MTSTISLTLPAASSSLASSVMRSQFGAAASDINALQAKIPQTGYDTTNDVAFRDVSVNRHLLFKGGSPTATAGVGAGTGASVSIVGSDSCFFVVLTTGTSPTTSSPQVNVTFNTAFATTPSIYALIPQNKAAFTACAASIIVDNSAPQSASTYVITSGTPALTASTLYVFQVLIYG